MKRYVKASTDMKSLHDELERLLGQVQAFQSKLYRAAESADPHEDYTSFAALHDSLNQVTRGMDFITYGLEELEAKE